MRIGSESGHEKYGNLALFNEEAKSRFKGLIQSSMT
jgi:hypothetical protein